MARRLQMTTADYITIAVSPALIMALVGSLVFFLLEIFYQGQYHARLQYILALFVFAAVLIGRISIDRGTELALLYGLFLAIVTWLAINKFVEFQTAFSPLINIALIAIIWWCSHKLTWDCTLIEESEDDAGEGLLHTVGLEQPGAAEGETDALAAKQSGSDLNESEEAEGTTAPDAPLLTWRQRLAEERRRPHTPGVWVLYFSLAALPIFGLGQRFIPAGNTAGRQMAFNLLCVYAASGLGLLLTTSFLSLRRYLRGRRLQMPAEMAGTWLAIGCVLIGALLLVAALIPRPSAEYAISRLPFRITSPADLSASRYASGRDGTEDRQRQSRSRVERDDAEPQSDDLASSDRDGPPDGSSEDGEQSGGESDGENQSDAADDSQNENDSEPGDDAESNNESADGNDSQRDGNSQDSDSQDGEPDSEGDDAQDDGQAAGSEQAERSRRADSQQAATQDNQSGDEVSPEQNLKFRFALATDLISAVLKSVFYVIAIVLVLVVLWIYRREVLLAIASLAAALREFWARLFGRKPDVEGGEYDEASPTASAPRPFADFVDPFATGRADGLPPEELVRYSFAAFEAWAREHGHERLPDETPHELARNVSARVTALSDSARRVARLYSQVAYAPDHLPRADVDDLRQLWWQMQS